MREGGSSRSHAFPVRAKMAYDRDADSLAFARAGGGLFGHYLTAISSSAFYFSKSFDIVEISIIGGMSSLSGSILGAIFFTIVPTFLQPLENGGITLFGVQLPQMFGLANIIMAVILMIIFRRQGLMDNSEIILDTWFRKDSYCALFKVEEWAKIPRFFHDIPLRIRDAFRTRKAEKEDACRCLYGICKYTFGGKNHDKNRYASSCPHPCVRHGILRGR